MLTFYENFSHVLSQWSQNVNFSYKCCCVSCRIFDSYLLVSKWWEDGKSLSKDVLLA